MRLPRLAPLLLLPILTLTACTPQTPPTTQIDMQVAAINHKTYEVTIKDPTGTTRLQATMGSGILTTNHLPKNTYTVQINTLTSGKHDKLTRTPICHGTLTHPNNMILITDKGCQIGPEK